jgi:hypothetical protein
VKALATSFAVAGIAAGAAYGGFQSLMHGSASLSSILATLVGTITLVSFALKGLQTLLLSSAALALRNNFTALLASLSGGQIAAIAVGIGLAATAVAYLAGSSARAEAKVRQMGDALEEGAKAGDTFRDSINDIQDEGLRRLIEAIATAQGLLGKQTGAALDLSGVATGNALITEATGIIDKYGTNTDTVLGKSSARLSQYLDVIKTAVSEHKTLEQAAADLGVSYDDLQGSIEGVASTIGVEGIGTNLTQLAGAYNEIVSRNQEYQQSVQDSILITGANQSAIDHYAQQLGVSSDFLSSKLGDQVNTIAGWSDETRQLFEEQTFGASGASAAVSAQADQMAEAVNKATDEMSDSIKGAFNIFEKVPKKTAPAFDVLLDRLNAVNDAESTLVTDLATLARRGVGTDLSQAILGDLGPAGIHRFATATDKELKRYVRAFEVNMALGDGEVVKEGVHLQEKANTNMSNFVAETLKAGKKLGPATQQVIGIMTDAFVQGNLEPAAFGLMTSFIQGIRTNKDITAAEARKLAIEFAHQLTDAHNFNKDGSLIINRVAQGVSQATGIPIAAVKQMMEGAINEMRNKEAAAQAEGARIAQGVARGVKEQQESVRSAGASLMTALANGINQNTDPAVRAAHQAAVAVKNQLNESLHDSPKYASFYMGREFAKQFDEGMMGFKHDVRIKDLGRVGTTHHRVPHHTERQKISVNVSRRKVVDEIGREYDYRG